RADAPLPLHPLSLHDALPIYDEPDVAAHGEAASGTVDSGPVVLGCEEWLPRVVAHGSALEADDLPVPDAGDDYAILYTSGTTGRDRKSTRLNSSHVSISYAVF